MGAALRCGFEASLKWYAGYLFSDGKVSRKTDGRAASRAPVPGGDYYGTLFGSEKGDHFGQKHLYT